MKFIYLGILIVSCAGIVLFDWKYKLAFFYNYLASIKSIAIPTALLLFIDILGINWKIFSTNQQYVVGLSLGSENIPIEELIFLLFINYFIICIYRYLVKRLHNA